MATYELTRQIPTYKACTAATVVAAASDKVFALIEGGSASKQVIIEKITISGPTLTAVAYNSLAVRKFSTAASGGTATALTETPLDSKFPAATAVAQVFTAAPTEGTLVGTIGCRRILMEATTAAAGAPPPSVTFDFTDLDGGGVVLHTTAEGVGVGFAAAPATAVTLAFEIQWKEL